MRKTATYPALSNVMKISHLATISFLVVSTISSIGAIGIVAHQYTVQRSAAQVVANTAVVERMQGLSDALAHVADDGRAAVVADYGFVSEKDFEAALSAQRRTLETSLNTRAEELATNDKRLTALLAACGFNAIIAIMSAIALYDIVGRQRRRAPDRLAECIESVSSPTTA
ncbi:hypothetical protein [Caballeronia sp. J97]|uniref:hypothetical protein n=1 Tax=Caballeronia sp. J97 TaxID=2805429 RepID=UPI002AB0D734|nr:hypothetical protein [Caballeronia sp. J97]